MLTNIELFNYSKNNPEDLLDPFYQKECLVIPKTKNKQNTLTKNNEKLTNYITTFNTLCNMRSDDKDIILQNIITKIIEILDKTEHINYSAFVQFFMVCNSTYSIYKSLSADKKQSFVYEMLKRYCDKRHDIYLNHGYSDVILQVMCDNYSHKRNSKAGINKLLTFLNAQNHSLVRLQKSNELQQKDNYYFLPDKGDNYLFESFLDKFDIKMKSRKGEHGKLPDAVFKHNGQYYICELKTMKGSGGGQNKQIVELAKFIKYSEKNPNIHYVAFLDCNYADKIFHDNSPKIVNQRTDIKKSLKSNPRNYFLNTQGLKKFIEELFK